MPSLIIKAPNTGISSSPHNGVADCRNLDISTIDGIARLNNLLAKKSATTVTGQVYWIVKDPTTPANVYALDSGGVVYNSSDSGATWAALGGKTFTVTIASPAVFSCTAHGLVANDTLKFTTTGALPTGLTVGTTYYVISTGLTADAFQVSTSQGGAAVNTSGTQSGTHKLICYTGAAGQGLRIWKDYLFVARGTKLDVYGTLASSPTWTFNWQTIDSDTAWHPMFVSSNDGNLYGGAGQYVFSVEEVSGQTFAAGTSASYTFTAQALDLPDSYKIKCLAEQGNNLMIGTWQGSNVYDLRVADIFPWDRSAPSFGQPIIINENGVHSVLNINGILYIQAGIEGKLYQSNGVQAWQVAQIPSHVSNLEGGNYLEAYPGALINYKGRPFFGIGGGGTAAVGGIGVYSLQTTSRGTILVHEHTISTGNSGASNVAKITALCDITRDSLLVGWRDNTTYGVDKTTATSRSTSYTGYFDSAFYNVGTPLALRRFQNVELQLDQPLATGEGVKIEYRSAVNGSWTTLDTVDFTTYGAIQSRIIPFSDDTFEFIQFRVSLTTGAASNTSPQFKQLIVN